MSAPAVSIITPTFNRHELLKAQHANVLAQSRQDFEWLILDDGLEPCPYFETVADSRIRYHHLAGPKMLVSAKRNWLCERAKAPVIAQFDDDDYYAPDYLAAMTARLAASGADITKLSAWFVYSAQLRRLGYWDTAHTLGLHFTFGPEPVLNAFFNQAAPENMKGNYAGYGFSYVFKKSMWETAPFPHVEYASDYGFVSAALAKGCRLDHFADQEGLALHILRRDNMSKSFPQYLLPDFMLKKLFPADLSALLDR
ncbi:MAG TPA: glycosyltransferase family A protein [Rhizomicrobium sp.]|jgi:glycosyltransferase involved in cell wall biosynthesis|nr:glycosyltransferase family A protein [Rhizomicrobium sp.]